MKAAHDALDLAVSSAKNFGEHDPRRLTIYVEANEKYETRHSAVFTLIQPDAGPAT